MDWLQALILGIVEGVTEYLPVSSTGHLLLAQRLLGIPDSDEANAYAICIQAGAIMAVVGLYFRRIISIGRGFLGKDEAGFRLGRNVALGFLPALAVGLVLDKIVKRYLFAGREWGLWPIIGAWFVGGVAILIVARYVKRRRLLDGPRMGLDNLSWKGALIIGLCQCLAVWPGTSRSLVTIVGGVLVGLRLSASVEFSFLLGVLTLCAATAKDAFEFGALMLQVYGLVPIFLGFGAAWFSAVVAVKWMVRYLNRHGMEIFGYYRIALAITVAVLVLQGWLLTGG